MRLFAIAALVWALAGLGALAQTTAGGPEETIQKQLDAFNNRDIAEAWTYASPMIQSMFRGPDNFAMMVQRGYPMVWDNADVQFTEQRQEGPFLVQRLTLRDANGDRHVLDYVMIEGPDGWVINGVALVPAPDVGV